MVEVTRLVEAIQDGEATRPEEESGNSLADNLNLPLSGSEEESENDTLEATIVPTAPHQQHLPPLSDLLQIYPLTTLNAACLKTGSQLMGQWVCPTAS